MAELQDELRNAALPAAAADAKVFIEGYLVRFCDVLNIAGRAPDVWEVNQALASIGAIDAGWFHLAKTYLELAMEPPEHRAEQWRAPNGGMSRLQLEQAVHDCQRRPVRVLAAG
jgi:hypothetical protein